MQTPTLDEMGINNPKEISRYSLKKKSARKDVLNIYYKRAKGSLLPVRRTYEFGRSIKTIVADSGQPRMDDTYEISPQLLAAVKELDTLLKRESTGAEHRLLLLHEIDELKRLVEGEQPADAVRAKLKSLEGRLGNDA